VDDRERFTQFRRDMRTVRADPPSNTIGTVGRGTLQIHFSDSQHNLFLDVKVSLFPEMCRKANDRDMCCEIERLVG
jgi:hypothetical protein